MLLSFSTLGDTLHNKSYNNPSHLTTYFQRPSSFDILFENVLNYTIEGVGAIKCYNLHKCHVEIFTFISAQCAGES